MMVELGALFPQAELGSDADAVKEFALAAEDLGFDHILTYEHVLGANIDRPDRAGKRWPYSKKDSFLDPFALFSYMAAITTRVGFMTAILILPQRQTVLVAKQAATLDVLSRGRLRLAVGLGWNEVEYEALGENFHNRGKRMEEQVELMRALWTQDVVSFQGRYHTIDEAGLNPLPVQRPIPVWMGGSADVVLKRIARMADGWVISGRLTEEIANAWRRLQDYAREAGRDPGTIGLQGAVLMRDNSTPDDWRREYDTWQELGATHIHVNTSGADFPSASAHIDALRRAKEVLR